MKMNIGFIGTGAISEAVVVGLIQHGGWSDRILISERGRDRSRELSERFANVHVSPDNQEIVDQVEIVFVAVLPQQVDAVLEQLTIQNKTIVSLAAGISIEEIRNSVGDSNAIHRLIPMPPNEFGVGPIPVFPASKALNTLLSRIGTVIEVGDENHFSTFSASSALMATLFEMTATNARWIQAQGVSAEISSQYATSLFYALAKMADRLDPQSLQTISEECLTAGGLNEQVLMAHREAGWFRFMASELDKVMSRVQ